MSRSRLGLEAERLGSRLGLGHEGLVTVSIPASERVFSRAGLIMRPTRSRLSKASLSKLVFLK